MKPKKSERHLHLPKFYMMIKDINSNTTHLMPKHKAIPRLAGIRKVFKNLIPYKHRWVEVN